MLDGELECYSGEDGEQVIRAGPNDTVFLPRDIPHGFGVVGDEPCQMMITLTPGGFEGFFIEAGKQAEAMETPPPAEPDVEALVALGSEYQLEILGPIPN